MPTTQINDDQSNQEIVLTMKKVDHNVKASMENNTKDYEKQYKWDEEIEELKNRIEN